ncbi:MAG: ATP-dependent RNA helicase [Spirochaetales bacterium]|nr:ATP-dependent RNA helicase [Spirochaetales bacterium]
MDPHQLPVYREKERILDALAHHPVVVVESPTGSGKTTQLPLILHEAGYAKQGVIGVTQPRRIAAVGVSEYIARQLNVSIPSLVGYKMRFEDRTTLETRIKIMTDGTLLQEIKTDPLLTHYSVILVDEAHERSLNIDFILGLLKNILKVRPEFRVIVSSATINAEVFSTYFDGAPVVRIETQTFPVELKWAPLELGDSEDALILKLVDLVSEAVGSGRPGDILVFLSGEKLIKDTSAALISAGLGRRLWILPLYGKLSNEEQERVFLPTPEGKTKVILSTNIAETSVTIDGVTTVIDSGQAKINYYNPKTFTAALIESPVSKASCQQRRGRAGRTGPGVCYRLYSQENFEERPLYTLEEIYRTDLSEVVLRMAEIGIRDFESFDFLSPPNSQGILGAIEALNLLEALNPDSSLSNIGKMMAQFPLLPRHSRMIVEAVYSYPEVLKEVTIAATFLSTDSPFLLPQGEEMEARRAHHTFRDADGDFVSYLTIFDAFLKSRERENFCRRYYLDFKTMNELVNIQSQLEEILSRLGVPIQSGGTHSDYLCAVAKGLIQFVCMHSGRGVYRSVTAEKIYIHPGSVLFKETPSFLVAGEIVKTSRMYARSVSPLKKEWLERISATLFRSLMEAERHPQERPVADTRVEPTKKTAWQVTLGREVFDIVSAKGGQKSVILDWDKLSRVLAHSKAQAFSELKNLKGELRVSGRSLLAGLKANKIVEICRKIDPSDWVTHWPQGQTFSLRNSLSGLTDLLDKLMKPAEISAGSKKSGKGRDTGNRDSGNSLGFLSLQTDSSGQYWFRVEKNFTTALADSLASLEALADDAESVLDKADWKIVNQTYRDLNKML